ncbi:MAG TPA: hypothetical protein VK789_20605 [Bryobacteraceae bacterium]|jgi:hypothetical protein|nr:hypothetical protein [Bryobacteraceae bacterium]
MNLASWAHRVLLFSIVCHGVLLWRFWSEKLAQLYPFLTAFLAAEMLQSIILFPIRQVSVAYGIIYIISSAVVWLVAYLVVLELCRLTLEDYPGIASVGRKAITWCMGLALIISAIYAIPQLKIHEGKNRILPAWYVVERSTVLSLLLFLLLMQVFLFRYRLPLSRNRLIYATGYAAYFGIGVAQDIIFTSLGIRVAPEVSLWIVVVAGVILLAGAGLLRQEGEVKVAHQPATGDDDRIRLQEQLVEMNRLLTRAARGRG